MDSKKIWLKKSRLYLVLDAQVNGYDDLLKIGCEAARAGVDILQLRDKHGSAKEIVDLASKLMKEMDQRVPLIINDRIDVADACGSDGVHLGQDDLSVALARKILGRKAIIGRSCQTWAQAKAAVEEGADYLGFGSVFKTQTKPDRHPMDLELLQKVVKKISVPVFAIGGITVRNIAQLRAIGIERIAVTRALSQAKNIDEAVKLLRS